MPKFSFVLLFLAACGGVPAADESAQVAHADKPSATFEATTREFYIDDVIYDNHYNGLYDENYLEAKIVLKSFTGKFVGAGILANGTHVFPAAPKGPNVAAFHSHLAGDLIVHVDLSARVFKAGGFVQQKFELKTITFFIDVKRNGETVRLTINKEGQPFTWKNDFDAHSRVIRQLDGLNEAWEVTSDSAFLKRKRDWK
jgi:hypothetical protein